MKIGGTLMTAGVMFWIFMSLFLVVDSALFLKGCNTFFWKYKTPNELEKQRQILGLDCEGEQS